MLLPLTGIVHEIKDFWVKTNNISTAWNLDALV